MTKKISWLVSLSCIVLVLMLSILFVGCKDKKYNLKIESSMGGNVSITIGDKEHKLEDLDSETFKVKENATVTLVATPKTGYEFEKWILNDSFSYSEELKINIDSDSTYVAVFTPSAYTLTFKHNGNVVGSTSIYVNSNLESINYPAMNGYENVTWEEIDFDKTNPSDVVINTLTGSPIEYTISFVDENDQIIGQQKTWTIEDKDIEVPTVPSKKGYDGQWSEYSLDVLDNKVVRPVYTLHNYTVTFKNIEGHVIATATINVNTDKADIEYPEIIGYKDGLWSKDKDSLFAQFMENPKDMETIYSGSIENYVITCRVDGKAVEFLSVNVKTDLDGLKSYLPTECIGFENIVWEEIAFDKSNPTDIEVNAISYDLIEYNVIFKKGEKEFGTQTITIETDLTTLTKPETPGYENVVWDDVVISSADQDRNIIVNIKSADLINYTITFKAEDDSVVETIDWNVENTTITEPNVPEKEGYTAAWEAYNFDTVGNIEVKPAYTLVNYTITFFDENGNVVGEALTWNVENKSITAPVAPTKTGYVASWTDYNFDTPQDIKVGIKYSKSMLVKYYYANGNEYSGEHDGSYLVCDIVTTIKTTTIDNEGNPVTTTMVDDKIAGHSLVTIEQFVDYLKGYSTEYNLVKINDSSEDLAQGIVNAYESALSELKVYFD